MKKDNNKISNTKLYISLIIIIIIFTTLTNILYGLYSLTENSIDFTIKTGERVLDICRRLSMYGLCSTKVLAQIAAKKSLKGFPFVPPPMQSIKRFEGLFSPGNYSIKINSRNYIFLPQKTTPMVLNILLTRSKNRFKLLHDNGKLSVYQQLILASIVEKEAVMHEDYCKIASVFYNRLNASMPLASCPTLEYALGYHRPFLTKKDTMFNSPYNLYRHKGLPPTPIATFSNYALWCVTHPIHTNYYFFVYDWVTKKCYFSHSYKEHLKNVKKAKENFILKYGKSMLFKKFPRKYYEP